MRFSQGLAVCDILRGSSWPDQAPGNGLPLHAADTLGTGHSRACDFGGRRTDLRESPGPRPQGQVRKASFCPCPPPTRPSRGCSETRPQPPTSPPHHGRAGGVPHRPRSAAGGGGLVMVRGASPLRRSLPSPASHTSVLRSPSRERLYLARDRALGFGEILLLTITRPTEKAYKMQTCWG